MCLFPSNRLAMKRIIFCFALVFTVSLCAVRAGEKKQAPLVVHEWGTFTSLQDEQGNAIGGINTDDEPVPYFVGNLGAELLFPPTQAPAFLVKSAPECLPDVTMRLETPVIYFHPPDGWKSQRIDVQVQFRGGWLTEFYPNAAVEVPGIELHAGNPAGQLNAGHIDRNAAGKLSWSGLTLGGDERFVDTDAPVWLAPRAVKAATVSADGNLNERFLFYRGLGNRDASLKIVRNAAGGTLEVRDGSSASNPSASTAGDLRISAAWLVDVRQDGACAFKSLGALDYGPKVRAVMSASFATGDYVPGNMKQLRAEMRASLVAEGLHGDEADALLNTWRVSYFQSPGLRFFYMCPRVITDSILPLRISTPADVTRVMIGRIEIVTPRQRQLLAKIAAGPAPDPKILFPYNTDPAARDAFFKSPETMKIWNAVMAGKEPYAALGFPVPELYTDYLQLGRFRNALLLDEQKHSPTPALAAFISNCGLRIDSR